VCHRLALVFISYALLNRPPSPDKSDFAFVFVTVLWTAFMPFYYIPWLLSKARKHPASFAIFIANTTLGWTFIFWAFILIWAASGEGRESEA
jgi:hypothetical protein